MTESLCPVPLIEIDGDVYLELRAHDGGKALVRRKDITHVVENCFGKAVVWGENHLACATIHEYAEVADAMKGTAK